jgi:mycothiol synthase
MRCGPRWRPPSWAVDVPLPDGYTLRPARIADGEAVMEMLNEETEALIGVPLADLDWVTRPWTGPDADRHGYAVVVGPGGAIAGYLLAESRPPHTEVFALGVVALAHHGRGLGGAIVETIEDYAAGMVDRAPPGRRVALHVGALADEPRVSALLRSHGFAEVRRFWLMRIEFGRPPTAPTPVAGIDIRALERGQERAVYRCMTDAFRDHWGADEMPEAEWIHRHVEAEDQYHPELWLLAWAGERLAGALMALPESVQEPALGYINEIGVRREFRRRGIGEALLRSCFVRLYDRGSRGALLHVDSSSPTGADRLYERVGMTAKPQFATWAKELVRDACC